VATDDQLREWGLERLIGRPGPEPEAVTRWRKYLAPEPAAPADPRAEALAQVAANPFDLSGYAEQRQALGLDQLGQDGQDRGHLDRWSR
jgi:hypothetical protein